MATKPRLKPASKKRQTPRTENRKAVLVYGSSGRMGRQLINQLQDHHSLRLAAAVDASEILAIDVDHTAVLKATPKSLSAVLQGTDIVIDFSSASGSQKLSKALDDARNLTVLVGTTGLPKATISALELVAKRRGHKILMAGNTSLGVATLARLSVSAARVLAPAGFDIEIIETHHRMKADSPSGTALLLASMLKDSLNGVSVVFNREGKRKPNTIGIHAIRGGGVVGEHDVKFISEFEEIKLSHRAFSRDLFAEGALNLALTIERDFKQGVAKNLKDFLTSNTL
jgi:4-hydroxy-tetrahydrodipicolinate reductase